MDTKLVDRIVNAVLYEGYILYPYRKALKNLRRWMFGIIAPQGTGDNPANDNPALEVHCLIEGRGVARLEVELRFLHLIDRRVAETKGSSLVVDSEHDWEFVESLEAGGMLWQSWEEVIERRVATGERQLRARSHRDGL